MNIVFISLLYSGLFSLLRATPVKCQLNNTNVYFTCLNNVNVNKQWGVSTQLEYFCLYFGSVCLHFRSYRCILYNVFLLSNLCHTLPNKHQHNLSYDKTLNFT